MDVAANHSDLYKYYCGVFWTISGMALRGVTAIRCKRSIASGSKESQANPKPTP